MSTDPMIKALEVFLHVSSHIAQEEQLAISKERLKLAREAAKRDERKLELYELRASINVQEYIDQEIRSVYQLFKSDKEQIEFMLTNLPADRAFGKLMIWVMFEYRKTQPISAEMLYSIGRYATVPQMKQVIQTYVDGGDIVELLQSMTSQVEEAMEAYEEFVELNMPERSQDGGWDQMLGLAGPPELILEHSERFLPLKRSVLAEKYPTEEEVFHGFYRKTPFGRWDNEAALFLKKLQILCRYTPDENYGGVDESIINEDVMDIILRVTQARNPLKWLWCQNLALISRKTDWKSSKKEKKQALETLIKQFQL